MGVTRTFRAGVLAALSLLVTSAGVRAGIVLSLEPADTTVGVGSSFSIDLVISGLGNGSAPSVSSFAVAVDYDPALLFATAVSFGDPVLGDQLDLFGFGALTDFDLSSVGTVSLAELSFDFSSDLDNFQALEFTLASIVFSALATTPGTPLIVDPSALILDSLGAPLDVQLEGAQVIIEPSAVPEPGTLVLLGLGLVGLSWRRQSRAARPN